MLRTPFTTFAATFAVAAAAALLVPNTAQAATTTYATQSSFTSATTGVTTITFDGVVATDGYQQYANGYTNGNVTFDGQMTGSNGTVDSSWIKGGTESGSYWTVNGTSSFLGAGIGNVVLPGVYSQNETSGATTVSFAGGSGYTAFGTQVGTNKGATNLVFNVTAYTASGSTTTSNYTVTQNTGAPTFIGFTSTEAFTKIVFTNVSGSSASGSTYGTAAYLVMDNAQTGTNRALVAAVPEPGVYVTGLSLLGMTGLSLFRGRRRQMAQAVAVAA